jgi:periplasmic protein TonB
MTTAYATAAPDDSRRKEDALAVVTRLGVAGAAGTSLVASAALHSFAVKSFVAAWLMAGFMGWHDDIRGRVRERMLSEYSLEIEPEATKPEPEKEPEPPKPQEPTPKAPEAKVADKQEAPAPAAAQAGKIMAADPDDKPVDFGSAFVQGNGDQYAGGKTDQNGTNKTKVTSVAAAGTGSPGPVGTGAQITVAPPKDCARGTRLRGGSAWDCAFPPEADTEQIDQASAVIEVTVNAGGRVDGVRIVQDPGHGFGRAARACAMSKAFDAAVGNECTPIASTKSFRVNFNR